MNWKNSGKGCEQHLNVCGESISDISQAVIISTPYSLFPMLFFPWNACCYHEERSNLGLIHTMKKMIL